MVSKKAVNMMVASAVALTIAGAGAAQAGDMTGKEKCYGVAKAGHNDCGSADKSHSCAGHATADGSGNEWVAVPAGLCDKLVGGHTTPGGDHGEMKKMDDHGSDHGGDHH